MCGLYGFLFKTQAQEQSARFKPKTLFIEFREGFLHNVLAFKVKISTFCFSQKLQVNNQLDETSYHCIMPRSNVIFFTRLAVAMIDDNIEIFRPLRAASG